VLPEFPVEKRTVAIGIWGAVGGLAAAVGPSAGGVLVGWLNWRGCFSSTFPFAFSRSSLVKILHESKDPNATKHVDLMGTALGFPGVALVTLAITQSSEWGYIDNRTILYGSSRFHFAWCFVQRCSTVIDPLLDLVTIQDAIRCCSKPVSVCSSLSASLVCGCSTHNGSKQCGATAQQ
jgi:MFS family permease